MRTKRTEDKAAGYLDISNVKGHTSARLRQAGRKPCAKR